MQILSERIRQLRIERHMTQPELAEKLNVSKSNVSYWENDYSEPTAPNIKNIAIVFGCSADYLLGLSDNPEIK